MTNADRIRAMTDVELNELFREIYDTGSEDGVLFVFGKRTSHFEWTLKWLMQPAEGKAENGC